MPNEHPDDINKKIIFLETSHPISFVFLNQILACNLGHNISVKMLMVMLVQGPKLRTAGRQCE